ncbi:hypothetical protein A4X09_0g6808 [Tilletia walkeri]|uniref:Uncharacterized protein n=1 Tax=Tilletia walkeri TaxID=117179 RepID=A0A8X7N333_9BASI|nr:hypothetical protein A4X09_0g6808 [Tilletia walkeri]
MSFTQASDSGSQNTRAQDSFDLVRRLGDVVLKKQVVKRKEISGQVEALSAKLKTETDALCQEAKQKAHDMRSTHLHTMQSLKDNLATELERLLDCLEMIQDNFATAEATILASGGAGSSVGASAETLNLDMDELVKRAEALTQADVKLLREGKFTYDDIKEA